MNSPGREETIFAEALRLPQEERPAYIARETGGNSALHEEVESCSGATRPGRPYFVMELVRGMKITDYCDEKKLSTNARLDLFIQVCQAIPDTKSLFRPLSFFWLPPPYPKMK